MLKIAGIKGNLTWIGTRSIPYSYREVPTPISDNHMILSYSNQGETYFLDATGRYMPLGLPSSFIQGKEALISDGPDKFRIETVPVIPAEENGIAEVTQLELKGDDLTGKSAAKVSGYTKTDLFQYLETLDTPVKKEEFYNSFFQKGNNKFLIGDFGEQNTFAYDEDFGFNYDFRISDYAKELGDEIYVNLNLNREVAGYKLKKDRKTNVEVEYKKHYDFIDSLKVPEGFEVSYLPENFQVSSELFSASITYEEKPGEIVYRHQLSLNFLNLDLQQQKEFNKLIEKVEKAYKEIIVLKKTKQ